MRNLVAPLVIFKFAARRAYVCWRMSATGGKWANFTLPVAFAGAAKAISRAGRWRSARMAQSASQSDATVSSKVLVNNRWRTIRKLGKGAFGAVYEVVDQSNSGKRRYAMKMESKQEDGSAMKMEIAVLKTFLKSGAPVAHICQYMDRGETPEYRYVVMELVGLSLSELRKKRSGGNFSESTSVRLGCQCAEAIEAVHRIGFVHRDVKPANFAMGVGRTTRLVYVLDFGLARQYITKDGALRPPRNSAGFRGTLRYASINAHNRRDLGRHDDLWSWLYIVIEFRRGQLPWSAIFNKDEVKKRKSEVVADQLLKGMPQEFHRILNELHGLHFADTPNYAWFYQQLKAVLIRKNVKDSDRFDWE